MDLIESNQGLVHWQAKRYIWSGAPYEDLVQEGNAGLMIAIERFSDDRGAKFSTYATWWVRSLIGRYAWRYHRKKAASLDAEDEDGRRQVDNLAAADEMSVERGTAASQLRTRRATLSSLTPREERVLRQYHGVGEDSPHTLDDVGQSMDDIRAVISCAESKTRQLRHPNRSRALRKLIMS